ncbi:hypothetical protein ACFOWZ_26225 [Lentzea rhizosphaerae]|uniref:Uncharacterized protein n=1 Tax=Lentzea rhizosphaerae TaxID=2041025 RepID=A0ABV8BZ04_9PSEU
MRVAVADDAALFREGGWPRARPNCSSRHGRSTHGRWTTCVSWPGASTVLGLDDRVAAVGGRLTLLSPVGGGTTVRAEFSDSRR